MSVVAAGPKCRPPVSLSVPTRTFLAESSRSSNRISSAGSANTCRPRSAAVLLGCMTVDRQKFRATPRPAPPACAAPHRRRHPDLDARCIAEGRAGPSRQRRKRKSPCWQGLSHSKQEWRRGWDSNPRYLAVRLISNQVRSTTPPPLRVARAPVRRRVDSGRGLCCRSPTILSTRFWLRRTFLRRRHCQPQAARAADAIPA